MMTLSSVVQDDLIVGTSAFPGNPYDVHTLNEQVEQATILMPALGTRPQTAFVVLGYRGVDKDNLGLDIKHRERINSLTDDKKKSLKRIQAIKPIIGHLKADHRMPRCHLKGSMSDSLRAVLCAAGFNIRWLMRMTAKKRHRPFFAPATGQRFGSHWLSIARDFYLQIGQVRCNAFGAGVKMNFLGTIN
jgi:IS5 family transposase